MNKDKDILLLLLLFCLLAVVRIHSIGLITKTKCRKGRRGK